ncbi:MAG: hypothetical protein SPJ62_16305 [Inconstantimicrobium porci]|uniref:hypothetical protein n=1 Tax=Inconstantimicrobium porci TaxID=2652291 RepID=UPI002A9131FF|nr:hypothetical protein [Inconstantimicrobium porci]MDY5913528.1 hypothetical protein [Inconstantimicrobium porci]
MTLPYSTLFSRVLNKINDPKELSLDENDLLEIYTERLHSVVGKPRVRRLFSSISLDDEIQEMTFALNNSVDEESDKDFVLEILSLGMAIEWLQPQVDSIMHTSVMIGGKEEKKILDNHKNMIDRLDSMKKEQNKMIRDYFIVSVLRKYFDKTSIELLENLKANYTTT